MEKLLINCREFVFEYTVQIFDDYRITFTRQPADDGNWF
jgi:hypothetical protein